MSTQNKLNCKIEGTVSLNRGREKSLLNRHPWVFSGGIASKPAVEDGAIVQVRSAGGDILGSGYYNSKCSLSVRMLSFDKRDPADVIRASIKSAVSMRQNLFGKQGLKMTNAYRLINGEGDCLPGLIVDRYDDVLVMQSGSLGIDRLKPYIIELLQEELQPTAIYEKSNLPSRGEEELKPFEGYVFGGDRDEIEVLENGLKFQIKLKESQKTGFFLDQREMRSLIGQLAESRSLLNCFSYTGGFSVYAAAAGASQVCSVDISAPAIEQARKNFELNGLLNQAHVFKTADVFDFLREEKTLFDIVILDPPAFAKKKSHIESACRGYLEINRQGMQLVKNGGYLLTCSCSYYMDEKLFQQVLFQAAREAGKSVRIVQKHRHAFDHPVSIYHPEGSYLKSLLLQVEG